MRRIASAMLALVALVGCPRGPTTTTSSDPTPVRQVVWGDSLTDQVVAAGLTTGTNTYWRSHAGYRLSDWEDGESATDVIDTMQRGATSAVLALSTNDLIKDGGWNENDVAVWSWVIMAAETDDHIVVILPWVSERAELSFPGILTERDEARAWLTTYAPNYVDWRIPTEADPTILDGVDGNGDGIHAHTQAGVEARFNLTMEAVKTCNP